MQSIPTAADLTTPSKTIPTTGPLASHQDRKNTQPLLETTFSDNRQLTRIARRTDHGKIEIELDPTTGDRRRACEVATMFDGTVINDEVIYHDALRSKQLVTITTASGQLVRIVERWYLGSRVTYQGQTNYTETGEPHYTVNQHKDPQNDLLMHREEIYWLKEGHRAMTEHYYFNFYGHTNRYIKILFYASAGPFSQDTQDFHPETHQLWRRELAGFTTDGIQNYLDILCFDPQGKLQDLSCVFFDRSGKPIKTERSNPANYGSRPVPNT